MSIIFCCIFFITVLLLSQDLRRLTSEVVCCFAIAALHVSVCLLCYCLFVKIKVYMA